MNKGKIEQMGTPEEIYNEPESLFVTDFIGNANIFDSKVNDIRENDVLVDLYGNIVSVPKINLGNGIKKGEDVYLAIKPEAITINKNLTGFTGKVFTQSFLGASKEYEVEFGNSLIKIIESNTGTSENHIKTGAEVNIKFNNNSFRILKKD
jgi:ABC-type Fe3+/spermidine/putrescine transport system ATPase subunit